MNDFYYLSPLEFEMLVRPQSESQLVLPTGGVIEQTQESDLIYCLNNLCSRGALIADTDGSGFDVVDEYKSIIRGMVSAKAIIRTVGISTDWPVYYYLSSETAVIIEASANRMGKLKVGVAKREQFFDCMLEQMDLSDEFEDKSAESYYGEPDATYKMEAEEFIVSKGISEQAEEMLNGEYVLGVVDMFSSMGTEVKRRLAIYNAETSEKLAVLTDEAAPLFIPLDRQLFKDQIDSFVREYI